MLWREHSITAASRSEDVFPLILRYTYRYILDVRYSSKFIHWLSVRIRLCSEYFFVPSWFISRFPDEMTLATAVVYKKKTQCDAPVRSNKSRQSESFNGRSVHTRISIAHLLHVYKRAFYSAVCLFFFLLVSFIRWFSALMKRRLIVFSFRGN